MSKIICANKMQSEVLNSDARHIVITAEPGAGATYALVLKAIKTCLERKINCSFFVTTTHAALASGGVTEIVKNLIKDSVRFSQKSLIFTFENGSKLKLIPTHGGIDSTLCLSRDLMLFDANVPNEFKSFHLPRAYEAVVVDSIQKLEEPESWANQLGLLKKFGEKTIGFIDEIKHVKGRLEDNFLFPDSGRYRELSMQYCGEFLRTDF